VAVATADPRRNGGTPLDREVQQRAQRPQVGLGADRLARRLLGRHVRRRPDDHAWQRHAGLVPQGGHAEVGQLHVHGLSVEGDEHVCGLHVPVQHPRVVRGRQRVRHAEPDPRGQWVRQRAPLPDDLLQAGRFTSSMTSQIASSSSTTS
jgi:hypothetical protein